MTSLAERRCEHRVQGMTVEAARAHAAELPGWDLSTRGATKEFAFRDYPATVMFVNAVAFVAQREDHHPDIAFGYNRCRVTFSTHSTGGLSENDLICAAKVEAALGT
jgi:4a-hydroxytetrahydrobiopterin dehydratase